MVVAAYELQVDWGNNGTFDGGNEDISADLVHAEWTMGRDFASQLTGRSRGGRLLANLNNDDGKYSSFNTSSPIYGSALPGRRVRLRATDATGTVTLWQGFLQRINPQVALGSARLALLEAVGPLGFLGQPEFDLFLAMRTLDLTGTLIGAILTAVGWPLADRDIDPGKTTIARATFGRPNQQVSVLDALHRVEETENGFLHESKAGLVIFEDRDRRLKAPYTVSVMTLSDDTLASRVRYSAISQIDPLKQIFNVFQTNVQRFTVGASAVLWTHSETGADSTPIRIGESITLVASFQVDEDVNMGVDAWTTPVATTDYLANSAADGSGSNLTSSIGVVATKFGTQMFINLTNNHASLTAYITFLQARGTPITRRNPVKVFAESTLSQAKYGKRVYTVPAEMIPDTTEGRNYVDELLAFYKDPRPIVAVTVNGNRDADTLSHVLRRNISDRVTIEAILTAQTALGINQQFFIESAHHTVDKNKTHRVTWECSGIPQTYALWVLGIGAFDTTTMIHY